MARIQDAVGNPVLEDVEGSGSLGALNAEVEVDLHGQAVVAVQVANIGTMTIAFEASVDGSNWSAARGIRLSDGALATTTTTDGIWAVAVGGCNHFRARVSAYTAGTADVTVKAGQGTLSEAGGAAGGGLTEPVSVDDNGGSLTVDGTVSISGIASVLLTDGVDIADITAAGAVRVDGSAVTQPISAASLPLPTGAATAALQTQPGVDIGDVTVNNAAGTNPVPVQGNAAHDAAVAGNPVLAGARANMNEPTAVADADATHLWADLHGRLVTIDGHPNPEAPVSLNATASGNTTVIAAPGGGVSIHVRRASVHNRAGTTRVVALTDGAGGTVRWRAELGINGGGSLIDFGSHGWALTSNTALVVNLDAAGDVDVNITDYYLAP